MTRAFTQHSLTNYPVIDISRLEAWVFTRRQGYQIPDLPAPGARVARVFRAELHQGQVTRVARPHDDEPPDAPIYFHVVYDDGDEADYTREELMPMLSTHAQSDFRHLAQGHEAAGEVVGEG